jgi:hypothetical protein
MTELQFRKDLYDAPAVAVAIDAFSPFADIERETRDDVEIVRLTAKEGEDEVALAGELANYVLGATVDGVASEEAAS